jgi:16S rRNA (guanine527-N7)-methyltransferase
MKDHRNQRAADPAAPAGMEAMGKILGACGLDLSEAGLRQLWTYHSLLRERNPDLNLTRIHNFANMVLKLYADSMLPANMMELPSPLLDLGTGPGMPGIPLKIYRPEIEIILAESRGKRVEFLNEAADLLGLPGLRVLGGLISGRFEEPVAGVITRAVESVEKTLERVQGCLVAGGRVIFMKGPHCDPEIDRARARHENAFALESDQPYAIPGTRHRRRLLVYRRLDEPAYRRKAEAAAVHPVHAIASDRNPRFKEMRKLLAGRGIRKSGLALVSGARLVAETLAGHPQHCQAWVSREGQAPPPAGSPPHLEWLQLDPGLFSQLDGSGTGAPLLLIRHPEITRWDPEEGFPAGCSVLIPFQDPENVGAAVRSAAALGASQVILLSESAHPFHPKSLRASGGAVLGIRLRQGPAAADLPQTLPIVALSAEGEDLRAAAFPPAFGLLAGMEGPGLPHHWRPRAVRIPMSPGVESLNAAAAVAVALYAWRLAEGGRLKAEGGEQRAED